MNVRHCWGNSEASIIYVLILTFYDGCLKNLSYDFGCMLSIGTIHFEDRFCASKNGGNVGGSTLQLLQLVATVGCRKALVSTTLVIFFLLSSTNMHGKCLSHLTRAPFLAQ